MKHYNILIYLSLFLLLEGSSYVQTDETKQSDPMLADRLQEAEDLLSQAQGLIAAALSTAPSFFEFARQGEETVDTKVQIFRQLLMEDTESVAGSLNAGSYNGTGAELLQTLKSYCRHRYDAVGAQPVSISGSPRFTRQSPHPTLTGLGRAWKEGNQFPSS